MNQKQYERTTDLQFTGRKVVAIHELSNGWLKVPIGTICTIRHKSGGFSLETEPCPTCHVSVFINRVPPKYVDLLPEPKPQLPLTPQVEDKCSISRVRDYPGCFEDCDYGDTDTCPHKKPVAAPPE